MELALNLSMLRIIINNIKSLIKAWLEYSPHPKPKYLNRVLIWYAIVVNFEPTSFIWAAKLSKIFYLINGVLTRLQSCHSMRIFSFLEIHHFEKKKLLKEHKSILNNVTGFLKVSSAENYFKNYFFLNIFVYILLLLQKVVFP